MKQIIRIVLAFCAVSYLQSFKTLKASMMSSSLINEKVPKEDGGSLNSGDKSQIFKVQAREDSLHRGTQYEIQYGSDIYGGEGGNYGYQDSSQQYNQQQELQDYQQLDSFDFQGNPGLDGSFTQQTDSDLSGMRKQVSQSSSLSTFQGTGQKMFGQPDQSGQQEVGYTMFEQQDQPGQQQIGYTMYSQQDQPGQQQLGYTTSGQQDQYGQQFRQQDQSSFLGTGLKPFAQKQDQSSFQGMAETQFGQEQNQQDMGQKTFGKQPACQEWSS